MEMYFSMSSSFAFATIWWYSTNLKNNNEDTIFEAHNLMIHHFQTSTTNSIRCEFDFLPFCVWSFALRRCLHNGNDHDDDGDDGDDDDDDDDDKTTSIIADRFVVDWILCLRFC